MTEKSFPAYIDTHKQGKLEEKIERLNKMLASCTLCPRKCKVNRLKGEKGYCGAGKNAAVSSYFQHFGEESCLVGRFGSGTIFFSFCNLKCIFCQNYDISHFAEGIEVTNKQLAKYMIHLQNLGCHNINFVTPTHFVPQILEAIKLAIEKGLNLPLVFNCGGYESGEVIELLDGVLDIYMPDAKFSSDEVAKKFCNAPDYFSNLKNILKLMHKQVGNLEIINGIAKKGLLIRHLVMPNDTAGTKEIMEFIAKELSTDTFINIMDQYRPCGESYKFREISRTITQEEFENAMEIARSFGLYRFG